MIDQTNGALEKAKIFANEIGMLDNLLGRLKRLDIRTENRPNTVVELYDDFAPYSFAWAWLNTTKSPGEPGRIIMNGGLIFHGRHDGGGNGGPPTFSVSLTPTTGWSIHT